MWFVFNSPSPPTTKKPANEGGAWWRVKERRNGVVGFNFQFTIITRVQGPAKWRRKQKGSHATMIHVSPPRCQLPAGVLVFKAPAAENFAWLPVGSNSDKTGRGSVSLI